ncbi:MAG: ribokinase [bacterium]
MPVSICVVGSFVMDFIFETPRRPVKGESVIGKSFHMATGGKGANQAMQAGLLGADVKMIGRVGQDMFGDMQLESLSKAGVDVSNIIRDHDNGTGVASIVLDPEGDNSIVMVPRANMACRVDDVKENASCIDEADIVLIQLEIPMKVTRQTIKMARAAGKRIILDPAPACALEDYFFENVDIMTPNETEASILSGVDVSDPATAREAALAMHDRGAKTVVVTMGEKGVLLSERDRAVHFTPYKIKAADTTAAGDAFAGALAVFLGEGNPMDKAISLAAAAGALCATKIGAQPSLPSRVELEDFLKANAALDAKEL